MLIRTHVALRRADGGQQMVAFRLQVWPVGVVLAQRNLLEMATF